MSLHDNRELVRQLQQTQIHRNRLKSVLYALMEVLEKGEKPSDDLLHRAREALK